MYMSFENAMENHNETVTRFEDLSKEEQQQLQRINEEVQKNEEDQEGNANAPRFAVYNNKGVSHVDSLETAQKRKRQNNDNLAA